MWLLNAFGNLSLIIVSIWEYDYCNCANQLLPIQDGKLRIWWFFCQMYFSTAIKTECTHESLQFWNIFFRGHITSVLSIWDSKHSNSVHAYRTDMAKVAMYIDQGLLKNKSTSPASTKKDHPWLVPVIN